MQKNTSNSVKFNWYRKIASAEEWKKYTKEYDDKYPILEVQKDSKGITFAYMKVEDGEPSLDLPCDNNDLMKIKDFCERRNLYPRPFFKAENSQQEIKVAQLF